MSQICTFTSCSHEDRQQMESMRTAGEFFWLDLTAPDDDTLAEVGTYFGWHPLLIEDLQHGEQRPKVEEYADYVFIVATAAVYRPDDTNTLEFHEYGLVVHGDYLVTVSHTAPSKFDRLRELARDRADLSEAALVHRVLDGIVDVTLETAERLESHIEHLEVRIDQRASHDVLVELRRCRRDIVRARSSAVAQNDALTVLSALLDELPGFEQGLHDHFRDVVDHSRRVVEDLELGRLLLDDAFEAYYTMLVARQGNVAQRLTVVATIFLPLTFVTGFFGQNFGWMVRHIATREEFLFWGVGTCALTTLLLILVFSRLKWW
jgi:magnesium transporter